MVLASRSAFDADQACRLVERQRRVTGVNMTSLWCAISMADVETILIQVRSRLLDFCLELQEVVGVEAGPKERQEKAAKFDAGQVFQTAIYDPGTVIVGGQNVQVNPECSGESRMFR
jgi:hypothetical protein